jgi:hypothetical protein
MTASIGVNGTFGQNEKCWQRAVWFADGVPYGLLYQWPLTLTCCHSTFVMARLVRATCRGRVRE